MKKSSIAASFLLIALHVSAGHSQGESALPFLSIHPSVEANGWGNVGTTVISGNPIATVANPAQLGLFSLGNYFAVSSYVGDKQWLPQFQQSDLTYGVWALSAGYDLSKCIDLPFPVGVAVGYSRVDLNLGEFVITGPGGPDPIGTFNSFEKAEAFSIGIGVDYHIRLGLGMRFNNIVSTFPPAPAGPGKAEGRAMDFGLLLDMPVMSIIRTVSGERIMIGGSFSPITNISAGYAYKNHSSTNVIYTDPSQADPWPRSVTIGLNVEFGLATTAGDQHWNVITFSLAREAEDLLITRNVNGFTYQSGLGDISFSRHVLQGKLPDTDRVNLHKGWQLNLAEIAYIRGGSFAESPNFGNRNYSTSGFGIHSAGIFKMIEALSPETLAGDVGAFLRDHTGIAYDQAEYDAGPAHPLNGTTFHSLSLFIR